MFKITTKTKVATLNEVLNANAKAVKKADKTLGESVQYALANPDKATRKDLVDLVKEVMTALGDKFIEPMPVAAETKPEAKAEVKTEAKTEKVKKTADKPKAENSVKKTPVKKTKVEKSDAETEEVKEEKTKATKKSAKKSAKKTEGVKDLENSKALQMAESFPETIEIDGEEFKLNHDIKTMDDLLEAYMADVEIEFAFYWTKRHLKQFTYYNGTLGQPKSFPNDLDTAQLVYVDDQNKKVAYAVSDSNFPAVYGILASDLNEDEGVRYCQGIEYQIYTK